MEEVLHQLIGSLSQCLQGFIHPKWCRISAINSMAPILICSFHFSGWSCPSPKKGINCFLPLPTRWAPPVTTEVITYNSYKVGWNLPPGFTYVCSAVCRGFPCHSIWKNVGWQDPPAPSSTTRDPAWMGELLWPTIAATRPRLPATSTNAKTKIS